MATKHLSLFMSGLNVSKTNAAFDNESISSEGERKQSRRFSQLFGSMKEREVEIGSHCEIVVPRSGEEKRSRRFSKLFAGSTTKEEIDDGISLSGEEKSIEVPREKDTAAMVFKLFATVLTSRQGPKHKRNNSTRSATPYKPQPRRAKSKKEKRIKVTVNIRPFWKQQKQVVHPATTADSDTLSSTPTVVKNSKEKQHERSSSVCDSKFSSISSAISFTSLPHELITLTAEQCTILLHLIRKVRRSLQKQERLTTNFSINLAHLFARKERIIDENKRLGKEVRKMLLVMMNGLRDLVGRTFLKKAVFLQRSLQLVRDISEMLEHDPLEVKREGKVLIEEVNDSGTAFVPTAESEYGHRMSRLITSLPTSTSSLCLSTPPHTWNIDIHHYQHTMDILREDIAVQQQLDAALRAGIVGPCEDMRFPAAVSERIAMRRFVGFVDGCLWRARRCYEQEARVVKGMDILGCVLKDGRSLDKDS